ncbi:amino acid transporter AVT6E [Magnolia sinica]|uniref:amino acid transporter AVT6E n=1 Tax=Magnolia sinica TaxID=86752 RepID=UPI00265A5E26|nr:amino acid transporter AVT6E [Magnolia sinica]
MDSNYSAIPRNSYIELQIHDESADFDQSLKNPEYPTNLSLNSFPIFKGKDNPAVHLEPLDDEDGTDEFPLIVDHAGNGSGIPGAVFNLTTSIIGAGLMALPATTKVLGLALGFTLIILMGILSEISVELLIRFSVLRKASSYGEIVQFALGRPARIISEICIIINNAGVLVVYLIIVGDVMSGSPGHNGVMEQWLGHGFWDDRQVVIFIILVIFLAPLCSLERIDSLSLTSAASVALAVVFVVVTCVIAMIKIIEGQAEAPRWGPDIGSKKAILDLLVVIPIMTNAYVCHFNVQPIYNELEGRSPKKMNQVGRITTVLCIVVYAATAISGYLLFGEQTESDILTNFDRDNGIPFSSVLNYIVRVGYVLHLVLVFPVIHFSLRQTVDALAFKGSAPLTESRKRSLTLTVVLLALIYLASTMIPNIWVAFKFTGATTAVSLGFIFPSLIALKLNQQGENLEHGVKILSWVMLVLAVLVSIIGVTGNIYSINSQSE